MKKILFIALALVVFVGCKDKKKPEIVTVDTEVKKEKPKEVAANYDKAEFKIEGMTCAIGCAKRIEKKLANMEGVKSATVDFDKKLAMVEYNQEKIDFDALTSTVTKVSKTYKVSDIKKVDGFSK